MIFGKHQRHIRLEGRMTPDQSMAADFLGQPRHAEGFLGRYIYSQDFHGTREVFNGIVFTVAFMGTDLEAKNRDK